MEILNEYSAPSKTDILEILLSEAKLKKLLQRGRNHAMEPNFTDRNRLVADGDTGT